MSFLKEILPSFINYFLFIFIDKLLLENAIITKTPFRGANCGYGVRDRRQNFLENLYHHGIAGVL
jgi:hypothetical protein